VIFPNKQLIFFLLIQLLALFEITPVLPQYSIDQNYSKGDSLRGSLNEFRSCFDVKYYDLLVGTDLQNHSISGMNRIQMEAVRDFDRIQLDLFSNMFIDSVIYNGNSLSIERTGHAFFIQFPGIIKKGKNISVTIYYNGRPAIAKYPPWDGGFVWAKDSLNRDWVGVSCQGIGASLWWPNKDHLSDRPDSMRISVVVPNYIQAISNGKLIEVINLDSDNSQWIWEVSYPINNYNVTINIGHFAHLQDHYMGQEGKLDLNYYVLDYNLEIARQQFKQVQPMLKCYEQYFGPFPFYNDGYKLVETPYYGMEHQSCISYGNDFQNNEFDFDYIIIHESGHEYWGNCISIRDMGELWIHEGFATYMESLFIEYFNGKEIALEYLAQQKPSIENRNPMLGPLNVNYDNWMDTDIYYKGSWMLHTIRSTINDDEIWFDLLKSVFQHFKYRTVTSEEIIRYMDSNIEYDLKPIFNNFLNIANPPELRINIKQRKEKVLLKYSWRNVNQDFNMPVDVHYGKEVIRLYPGIKKQKREFHLIEDTEISFDTRHSYFMISIK
jgi:aminopeptidase N